MAYDGVSSFGYWLAHEKAWSAFWSAADVRLHGAAELTQALRFNSYQLRIATDHELGQLDFDHLALLLARRQHEQT